MFMISLLEKHLRLAFQQYPADQILSCLKNSSTMGLVNPGQSEPDALSITLQNVMRIEFLKLFFSNQLLGNHTEGGG